MSKVGKRESVDNWNPKKDHLHFGSSPHQSWHQAQNWLPSSLPPGRLFSSFAASWSTGRNAGCQGTPPAVGQLPGTAAPAGVAELPSPRLAQALSSLLLSRSPFSLSSRAWVPISCLSVKPVPYKFWEILLVSHQLSFYQSVWQNKVIVCPYCWTKWGKEHVTVTAWWQK